LTDIWEEEEGGEEDEEEDDKVFHQIGNEKQSMISSKLNGEIEIRVGKKGVEAKLNQLCIGCIHCLVKFQENQLVCRCVVKQSWFKNLNSG